MSLKKQLVLKTKNRNLKTAFHNEAGAIDLASMVGILVVGLISGVIASTVFTVIPWAQDNAAKQQLDAVNTAQSARAGLSGGMYSANLNTFLDTSAANVTVRSNEIDCFGAFVTSASGSMFYTSSAKPQPVKIAADATWPSKPTTYPANCSWPSNREAASVPDAVNYVLNPSAEIDNTSTTFSVIGVGARDRARLASPTAHSGQYVFRTTARDVTESFGYGAWTAPLEPGTYVASLRVRASTPMTLVYLLEGDKASTSADWVKNANSRPTTVSSEWQTLWVNVTVTRDGTVLKPGFLKDGKPVAGEWVEMDSIQVIKATGNNTKDSIYAG
jgi:hypothetical protein